MHYLISKSKWYIERFRKTSPKIQNYETLQLATKTLHKHLGLPFITRNEMFDNVKLKTCANHEFKSLMR
jgi:hypothetical protein